MKSLILQVLFLEVMFVCRFDNLFEHVCAKLFSVSVF